MEEGATPETIPKSEEGRPDLNSSPDSPLPPLCTKDQHSHTSAYSWEEGIHQDNTGTLTLQGFHGWSLHLL